MKQYAEAISDFDKAIDLNKDYAEAYNNRGLVKYDLKHYDAAIEDYGKAIELKPDYALAYNNRGVTYKAVGKKTNARLDCERALELAKAQNDKENIERVTNNLALLDK